MRNTQTDDFTLRIDSLKIHVWIFEGSQLNYEKLYWFFFTYIFAFEISLGDCSHKCILKFSEFLIEESKFTWD